MDINRLEPSDKLSELERAAVVERFGGVSPAPRVSFRTPTNDSFNSFTYSFTIRLIFGHLELRAFPFVLNERMVNV